MLLMPPCAKRAVDDVVNSVFGSLQEGAAGHCVALQHSRRPDFVGTVFAGADVDATARARAKPVRRISFVPSVGCSVTGHWSNVGTASDRDNATPLGIASIHSVPSTSLRYTIYPPAYDFELWILLQSFPTDRGDRSRPARRLQLRGAAHFHCGSSVLGERSATARSSGQAESLVPAPAYSQRYHNHPPSPCCDRNVQNVRRDEMIPNSCRVAASVIDPRG